ncbi:polysaccharide biosynthesis/export family protein [candidate division KSB1 bacterium]|nr:polysaccharide biosynthesis/export family protein [candidate division KSB1 bacterium]MBL7092544.1 polysaccharide biosynthesis/export family protein [candidate division KSB1 bacterium]
MIRKKKNTFTWFTLFLILLFSIIFESVLGTLSAQSLKKNEFYPGDALLITFVDIYKEGNKKSFDIGGEYKIDTRGYIMMPLIGSLKVIGYNRLTLAEKIKKEYKAYFTEPYITILPLIRVTLMGPFFRPGSYRVDRDVSLWDLIDRAGGPRDNCNLNSIKVVRDNKVVIKNLLASFEKAHSLAEIGIESGDQIKAKRKTEYTVRLMLDYIRFAMSIVSMYLIIRQYR